MDELRIYRAKKEVFDSIIRQGIFPRRFSSLINIYLDMLKQKDVLETKLKGELKADSRKLLEQIYSDLLVDIESYRNRLII